MSGLTVVMLVGACTHRPASPHLSVSVPGSASPDPLSSSSTTTSPASSTSTRYGGAVLGGGPCFVGVPAAWDAAVRSGVLWHSRWDATASHVPSPDGAGVLHEAQHETSADIQLLGAGARVVENLGTVPRPPGGQMTNSAATADHIAFVYNLANDESASFRWVLYLWDRHTKRLSVVARNPVDSRGRPRPGGWIHPVLTAHYLYWITAAPTVPSGWGGSALKQYDLHTGTTRTLYSGLTEAFVPYGDLVLYTALVPHPPSVDTNTGKGAPERVYAVDQRTGRQVLPPRGLTAGADGANEMQTDGDLVIWNAALGALRAWRPTWGHSISLIPQDWQAGIDAALSSPRNPRIFGHFLIWQPGRTWAFDLRTNSIAQLSPKAALASESDVAGSYLSMEVTSTPLDVAKTRGEQSWDQYLIDLHGLPGLDGCR